MKHPLHQFKFCPKCGSDAFQENNFKSNACSKCGFVYYMNVSGAVAVFILNNNNELLVCRRAHDPAKGTLDLPGGFVDLHETAEEAVMREIEEETGLIISELTYKFSLPNQYLYSDFEVHTLDLFYQATANDTTALEANDDVEDCKFVAINELQPTDFGLKSIRIAIDRFIKEQNNR